MPTVKSSPPPSSASASSVSETGAKLVHYLRAGYPGLYLLSHEEQRVEAEFKTIAAQLGYSLCFWSVADGLVNTTTNKAVDAPDPLAALDALAGLPEKSVVLLKDYHLFLQDPHALLLRKLKDMLLLAKTQQKHLVIPACRLCLPPELEREFTVVEFPLPGSDALRPVLENILLSAKLAPLVGEAGEAVLAAASGLTTMEAENAFALSVVEAGCVRPNIVAREKAQAVKKTGLLEVIEARESLDDIGGLDQLKEWLLQRRHAFGRKAREYGLPVPKGVLIVGLPGTGKSLTAKATAQSLGVPLLKLDAGRIFAGLVGQSEANLRSVIQTAEAIAPCVLWCEELEKAFSGTKSSGSTDGGTTSRVFASFLTWLQEKTKAVFVVATANDVTQLPPELLRKGRFDELWFVDLPNEKERESIWKLVIERHGRDAEQFDVAQLARITDGFTGSEIEAAFTEAMFLGFERDREPTNLDIAGVLNEFVPLAKQMAEQITALRQWAKGRARLATSPAAPERRLRKLAA